MNETTQWFHDVTEGLFYRVDKFRHKSGRMMEMWNSSDGDSWYLDEGLSQSTFLFDHVLTPCDPVPGLLEVSKD